MGNGNFIDGVLAHLFGIPFGFRQPRATLALLRDVSGFVTPNQLARASSMASMEKLPPLKGTSSGVKEFAGLTQQGVITRVGWKTIPRSMYRQLKYFFFAALLEAPTMAKPASSSPTPASFVVSMLPQFPETGILPLASCLGKSQILVAVGIPGKKNSRY